VLRFVTWLILIGGLLSPCLAAEGPGTELRTEHFILYTEQSDPDDTARLLEAGYAHMKAFFNSEPDRKLQIKIFATRRGYQAAFDNLRKVFFWNKKHRSNMGLYARETATSYLWAQPDEYLTRRLLLHELAHQYHDLVRPWMYVPSLDYCDEGLAEYFSWHNWDGKVLELGIAPQISQMDYAASALQQLRSAAGFEFERVVYGDADIDYTLAWGLVSFLIKEYPEKFHIWRTGLNHEVDPKVAWQKQFGAVTQGFVDSFEQWLKQHSPPWQVTAGQWQPWGGELEGRAGEYRGAQAVLVGTPATFNVHFAVDSNAVQGVTFGFRGGRNFFVLERHNDRWEIANLVGSEGHRSARQTFPASGAEANLVIEPGDDMTLLKFDQHTAPMTNVTGRVGLWVERGKARFRCNWQAE
jgi:hypothetical protein